MEDVGCSQEMMNETKYKTNKHTKAYGRGLGPKAKQSNQNK